MANVPAIDQEGTEFRATLIKLKILRLEAAVFEICKALKISDCMFPVLTSGLNLKNDNNLKDGLQMKMARLSSRKRKVLSLFIECHACKKTAAMLGTKVQTVRNQLTSIRVKLELSSRAQLIAFGVWLKGSLNDYCQKN